MLGRGRRAVLSNRSLRKPTETLECFLCVMSQTAHLFQKPAYVIPKCLDRQEMTSESQKPGLDSLAPPNNSCVTSGKLLSLSVPCFSHL